MSVCGFVIIRDGQILFRNALCYDAANTIKTSISDWLTEYGLVIPLGYRSLLAFGLHGKFLGMKPSDPILIDSVYDDLDDKSLALLITTQGQLYLILQTYLAPFSMRLSYIPRSIDLNYAISSDTLTNDTVISAVNLTDTLDEAFSLVGNTIAVVGVEHYNIYNLDELVVWINRCLNEHVSDYDGKVIRPSYIKNV